MHNFATLLQLPAGLLILIQACNGKSLESGWPYNLPASAKYFPRDEELMKRDLRVQEKLAAHSPIGLKKMSDDENEKFWPQYWNFEHDLLDAGNTSQRMYAPIAGHWRKAEAGFLVLGRGLRRRDFGCPTGTTSCDSDSQACCSDGDTCITTNSGAVGCCASGSTCDGNAVGGCDTNAGYTLCEAAGGCCAPGASCVDSGCLFSGTQIVTTTLPAVTVTTGSPSSSGSATSSSSSSSTVSTSTSTSVSDASAPSTSITTTTVDASTDAPVPLSCSPGFSSCPSSLGGGCCRDGYACGSVLCECTSGCPSSSSSATTTADVPVASTSGSSVDTTSSAPSPTTMSASDSSACPTGFYMCSAYYLGGCCRVGRNCETSSCPSTESTQIVSDPTVVVPASTGSGNQVTGAQNSCANGWYSCAADVNGGCCPSGFACGTATCEASASGVQDRPKQPPSAASATAVVWTLLLSGIGMGVAMIVL
ncbi:hypothetical protein K431DRAFT_284879 [Polychaeton citri CBS 116435]|uniref:GPI anchored protein n=1 Tax=Polychaeton citri CBS 116435 TaxID=1314669 RepID=A0A9P4UQX9_9PEZI|nr:hypothetical protein K431DRAFT_284879 [Polychaeton citri CBS 116435]